MDAQTAEALLDQLAAAAGPEADWQLATYDKLPLNLVRGQGARVQDADGRWYWDLYGGHCVALIGHSHPTWVAMLHAQAQRLGFYSNVVHSPLRAAACKAIVDFAPQNLTRVFLSNSGAEANEVALKLARHHTGRPNIVAMQGGFHGRTLGALAVTASEKYRKYALPEYGNTRFVPFGEPVKLDDSVAAVILEPIQSLAGVATAERAWFHGLRAECDRVGALLIFDEVQTAWGRMGTNFAADFYGVRVDLLTSAKGTAGGFPVGATLVDDIIARRAKSGDQGSTFGAGPLACAAILATHHVLREEGLVAQAAAFGQHARKVLPVRVRGEGALLGLCFDRPVKPILATLRERGFVAGGSDDPNVMRLMPPLCTPLTVLDELGGVLREILQG
ncbi:MAG TPA: aminotransferase class III-fold pyridoxal phosphate-dependent enzyme [Myxococcota bacterium]|nr:aminotransferase class III-fold pyridoxal phosphate-dependent enzyme [Myxococcota bacterium]